MGKWIRRGVWTAVIAGGIFLAGYYIYREAKLPQKAPDLQCETLKDEVGRYEVLESRLYEPCYEECVKVENCTPDPKKKNHTAGSLVAKVKKDDKVYNVEYLEGTLSIEDEACTKDDKNENGCEVFHLSYEESNLAFKEPQILGIRIILKEGDVLLKCEYARESERPKIGLQPINNQSDCPDVEEATRNAELVYMRYACALQPILDRLLEEKKEAGIQQTIGFVDGL